MTRAVLVHGSVTNGEAAWAAQRPLAERREVVVVNRPGFPPGPPAERIDFEADAAWLRPQLRAGDHLVAFEAICDVLARELSAERASVAGAGHGVQRAQGFNELLESFLARADGP